MIGLLLLALIAAATVADDAYTLPWFQYEGDSHYEFGLALGEHFRATIQARVAATQALQATLLPFYATPAGEAIYNTYLATHNRTFPAYVEEVLGMAHGSAVAFSTLFILNIIEEYSTSMRVALTDNWLRPAPAVHCTDIVLHTTNTCIVAHNEDSGLADVNRTAVVTAKIQGNAWFTAYTYLGDLPSGAFGANDNGVAFSLNYVEPLDIDSNGLGRGFVSRDLLAATSYDDAIERVTQPNQATGHNIQLMDTVHQRVANIEVASFNRSVVTEIAAGDPTFFHTNQYQTLLLRQPMSPSSYHRLRRYRHLTPPRSIQAVLEVLGDQGDTSYPIFHDATSHAAGELSNWTLLTVIFDVLNRKAYFLQPQVNPRVASVIMVLDLRNVNHVQVLRSVQERVDAALRLLQL
ncbi:hypothetical protein SPRG_19422 [Saprolegnia parasitica CBS 223.65]|uniref:Peptidase C45 hydrolase domain-containing protein n=1 Tax=Saprolegnia parasitica (strain CBS 223.65) TaxID=695850 RepID=A0A067CQM8_SAPPC|nr:hypothetical protein SPRG_19422 [Saprolegnia parasitica CBS 223.65]KDO32798.1 hypothetical protein SPRG_19422 [Saprolegnia parasitica CBS 223.65]|eukprot:XP_012196656.1 hypothetical protein SPRG_19422 [Saprolegnia parasitica CBS 223.65]